MKQWLVMLLLMVATLQPVHAMYAMMYAEDPGESMYDGTAWNVIRERFFNGENSYVTRFESDIRLQVIGAETHQDSVVFVQLVDELNELLETVQVSLVHAEPNFMLNVKKGGMSSGTRAIITGYRIENVIMDVEFPGEYSDSVLVNLLYYHTIRNLTKVYTPQNGSTQYGGIFDAFKPGDTEFTEIDKAILRLVYSHDFYKNLRVNTIKKQGLLSYLDLRYRKLIQRLPYAFKALLLLFGFLFFLSRESTRKQHPTLGTYIKQRALIPLLLPFFYSGFKITTMITLRLSVLLTSFLIVYVDMFICGFLVLVLLYYTEPFFMKRITSFVGKQAFVFLSTFISAVLVKTLLITVYGLAVRSFIGGITPATYWSSETSLLFLIVSFAALRVFYNVIQYRIQSMVNQKDVEIAKMKELKNQAELNALHARINPHFLYNSLNSIASLAHMDADKTEHMALGLSDLFRYSINKENKTYVTVDEELEMVDKYLDIEKIRFGDRLVYEIKVDEGARELQIPKFLIQPLVENAVKHGLSKMKDAGRILVEVKQNKKDLLIAIYDNGPDFPAEPVSGYGLQNLHDKLSIIYGNKASINWVNGADKHVAITLKQVFES